MDITERKQADEALQESEEKYRTLVEQSLQGLVIGQGMPPRLVFANSAMADILGYTVEELLSLSPEETRALVHAEDQPVFFQRYHDRLLGRPVPPRYELRAVRKDGTVRWVEMFGSHVEYGGQPAVQAAFVDITDRKQAESERDTTLEALRESEDEYRQLFELQSDAILLIENETGQILDANTAASAMYGYSREELLSKRNADLSAEPEETQRVTQTTPVVVDQVVSIPLRFHHKKDGTVFPVEITGRFFTWRGRAVHIAAMRDITERRQAEEELCRLKAFNEGIVQSMVEVIVLLDAEGIVTFANPATMALLGYAPEELVGQRLATLVPPDQQSIVEATVERRIRGEAVGRYELELVRKDGRRVSVLVSASPQSDAETGRLAGKMVVFTDISMRVRAEEALRRRTEQLDALRQVGLEMAAQLDLDTLLHSIVSRAVELLGGTAGGFYSYRPDREVLEVTVATGVDPALIGLTLRPGEGLAGRVWQRGEPLVVDDYRAWEGRAAIFDNQNFRAIVGVPVRWGDELLGVLNVVADAPGVFSRPDAELLSLFATQAAIAIQNARLFEETVRRNRELALLNRVIAASAASHEIEVILETVCRELAQAFGVSHAAAALLNREKTEALVVAEHRADSRPSALGQTVPVSAIALAQHLLVHKAPLVVDDARADPRLGPIGDLIDPGGPICLLILPILIDGEVMGSLGVAAVGPRSQPRMPLPSAQTFSPEEVDLAWRVAEQVSGALARARLAETQRRLSAAVDQAAEAVMIADTEGTILYVNPSFERITGYSRAEAIGQSPRILGSGKPDAFFHREMWQAVASGRAWQEQFDYRRRDGRVCSLDLTVAPVRDRSGATVNYVATIHDVTREVQLERQFQQAQKMEALGRLAGGVAHDFNNLLTVIHIGTQLLERQLHPQDPLWKHVREIQETGKRAKNLTGQLLSFSRQEVIRPRVLNLNQVVADLSRMLQRILGEDVRLTTALAGDLWPIRADPSQIGQVIVNLAVNARDAMPGGGALTIETANVVLDKADAALHMEVQPGEHVLLTVGDTGVGMDDEMKAHIFEPFFTSKERGQGTGLGLATVFGIVRQNSGQIEVYSQVGQGTTFKIYLPRVPEAGAVPEAPSLDLPPIATRLVRGTETVLLVEDEAPVRELAVRVLESCGYRVLAAGDGLQALQIGERHDGPIHLLLTDVVLPHMSGRELAGQLQSGRPEMRVLYMSGYTDDAIARHGALAPAVAFLAKPFTIEELAQTVREVLEGDR